MPDKRYQWHGHAAMQKKKRRRLGWTRCDDAVSVVGGKEREEEEGKIVNAMDGVWMDGWMVWMRRCRHKKIRCERVCRLGGGVAGGGNHK